MNLIESLNEWSAHAGSWAISHLVGTAVVLALVGLLWLAIRKRSAAALGCWLFLIVLLKPIIPFQIGVPQSWLPFQALAQPESMVEAPVAPVATPDPVESAVTGAPEFVYESISTSVVLEDPTTPVVEPEPISAMPAVVSASLSPVKLSWQSWLLVAWASIVTFLILRFVWLQARTARWLRPSSRLADLEAEVSALAAKIGLRRGVRVYSNPKLDTPLVCGLLKPSLMLPEGFGDQLDADQRRWVLLHELGHLKRGDLWVLAFQRLVQIAFFFNPSIWIANRAISRLREYACDDVALVHSEIDRRSCGEGFLRVVERAHAQPIPGAAALALFERSSDSKRRLARILDSRRKLAAGLGIGSTVLLLALGLVLLPGLRAQDPEPVDTVAEDDSTVAEEIAAENPSHTVDAAAAVVESKLAAPAREVERVATAGSKRIATFHDLDSFELVDPPNGSPSGQGKISQHRDRNLVLPSELKLVVREDGRVYNAGHLGTPISEKKLRAGFEKVKELQPEISVRVQVHKGGRGAFPSMVHVVALAKGTGIKHIIAFQDGDTEPSYVLGKHDPATKLLKPEAPHNEIRVHLKRDGKIYIDGDESKSITVRQLQERVTNALKQNSESVVVLRGTDSLRIDEFARVFDVLKETRISQISIAKEVPTKVSSTVTSGGRPVELPKLKISNRVAFEKFVREPTPNSCTAQVILARCHYFGKDVLDVGSKKCFRIRFPGSSESVYTFVENGSKRAKQFDRFEWNQVWHPLIEVNWVTPEPGKSYLTIRRILHVGPPVAVLAEPRVAVETPVLEVAPPVVAESELASDPVELPGVADTQHSTTSYRLAVPQPGIVRDVLVKSGDVVKKGQLLLKLDSRQAQAALEVAEIRASGLENELARKLSVFEAEWAKVEETLKTEKKEWQEWAKTAKEKARVDAGLPTTETNFAIARAELKQTMISLEQFNVVAPVDGTITSVQPKVGEYVTPNRPVFVLQRKAEKKVIREEKRR